MKELYTPEQIAKELRKLEKKICCILAAWEASDALFPQGGNGTATGNSVGELDGNLFSIEDDGLPIFSVQDGIISLPNVPEYEDNEAAILGGLLPGNVYHTGGILKIVIEEEI